MDKNNFSSDPEDIYRQIQVLLDELAGSHGIFCGMIATSGGRSIEIHGRDPSDDRRDGRFERYEPFSKPTLQ